MTDEEFQRRSSEDFKFLVLCQHKNNMGMYSMLRDRELEKERHDRQQAKAQQIERRPLQPSP